MPLSLHTATRRQGKIRDFAVAAANNSEDNAAISGRLESRYR
jgi:hypothetical protein